jgi:hypothetical protein
MNLFLERFTVALADEARKSRSFSTRSAIDSANTLRLHSINDDLDVDFVGISKINDLEERKYAALSAFWSCFGDRIRLAEQMSRILINPACHVSGPCNCVFTLNHPDRKNPLVQGMQAGNEISPIEIMSISGETKGYFDEVVLFSGGELEAGIIKDRLIPGTAVVIPRPRFPRHRIWATWAGVDFSFEGFISVLKNRFNLVQISKIKDDDVDIEIIGLESNEPAKNNQSWKPRA